MSHHRLSACSERRSGSEIRRFSRSSRSGCICWRSSRRCQTGPRRENEKLVGLLVRLPRDSFVNPSYRIFAIGWRRAKPVTEHWFGLLLSGVGATISVIGWEGRHRYRPLILLL